MCGRGNQSAVILLHSRGRRTEMRCTIPLAPFGGLQSPGYSVPGYSVAFLRFRQYIVRIVLFAVEMS